MFEKNIKIIEKTNPYLAQQIKRITLEEASKNVGAVKNENGEYILTQDNKYVDDTPSPLKSAEEVYSQQIKTAKYRQDFIIIFGLGLANLLDYVHSKSITNLILFEPDLNIWRFTCEYVDLTKYFEDGRLFISSNMMECVKYLEEKYLLDDKIEFVYLKNYVLQHPSEFTVLTERIYSACQEKIIDMNTIKNMSKYWISNIFSNIKNIENKFPINLLENKFKDKTALILGAGPSLRDNIKQIKANRDKFVIFAIHKTLSTLKENDITPDFCVIVDARWVKETLSNDFDYLKNINLIADIKSDAYSNSLPFKNIFTYYPENNLFSEKLHDRINLIKQLPTGGTSTICAYNSAKFMGIKNFIFAGLDLAFKNDTAYCDNKNVVTTSQNTILIQNIPKETTEVKSITGEYIKTRKDYAYFIKQFETIFAGNKNANFYNLSSFGAFINGMKYITAEEIFPEVKTLNDTEIVIKECLDKNTQIPNIIKEKSLEILKEEDKKFEPIEKEIDEWFEMYENIPSFFEYATNIITKITSSMLLSEYIEIELLKFSKLVLSTNTEEKQKFIFQLFTLIKNYSRFLHNLI